MDIVINCWFSTLLSFNISVLSITMLGFFGSKIGVIKSVKDESSCCDVIYCNLTG